MPLLFQGVKGSSLVFCLKRAKCKDKCGEKVLFNLGDQTSNKCKYFEPSELVRKGRETFKMDKVDWICNEGHTIKGVADSKANPCEECNQTFDDRLEIGEVFHRKDESTFC